MKQQWPLDVTVSFDPYFGEPSRDGKQGAEILPDGMFPVVEKVQRVWPFVLEISAMLVPVPSVAVLPLTAVMFR